MEETTAKFDGMLMEFGARRNAADGRLAEMEAGVVACAVEAETALDDDERREVAIAEELEALKKSRVGSANAVVQFRWDLDAARERQGLSLVHWHTFQFHSESFLSVTG